MTVSQVSVFTESKPGHLSRVLGLFEEAGVNVRGYSASDTGEYGIVRYIVDKPDVALETLRNAGCACTITPVLCLKLDDVPGELCRVMTVLARCGINVIYSYSMISTYIILSTPDIDRAERMLAHEPVELIDQEEITRIAADPSQKEQ